MSENAPTAPERSARKGREGIVTSDKMDRTAVVTVTERVRHARYNKTVQRAKKLYVHDETNDLNIGDRVRVTWVFRYRTNDEPVADVDESEIDEWFSLSRDPEVAAAVAEDVHLVGVSILSGSHMELVPEILRGLAEAEAGDIPVVVGGIIPEADAAALRELGVAAVFTPKDFGLNEIMARFVEIIRVGR